MTHQEALTKLKDDIRLRGLAESTHRSYVSIVSKFLDHNGGIPIAALNEEHIREYLLELIHINQLAPGSVNVASAALRFFFAATLNRTMNYLQIPRMKRPKTFPVILSRHEVDALISGCDNQKHKAMFLLAYGSGLRVGELVKLKVSDIDSQEMRLLVRGAKGNKDRYTILSQNTLSVLRDYWRKYRPDSPENYLFPGSKNVGYITDKAVSSALEVALLRASICKDVTPHTLRHCFATHLLEDGYSLLQIKELLGHSSIHSTTIYLHLANTTKDVRSPADGLTLIKLQGGRHD